ncbi:hypothetical protein [Fibrella forsythiae]|uniref:Uncharacterized protein n=1 Tax=Fibrella forsythiae TaxID=2817061 RepID=A0ABS3JHQ6_9BACT|nr:hypothetical protein [Fibrella forsythiae]MBO0948943.1 hypothetical protein [Fibrella forsythiae]
MLASTDHPFGECDENKGKKALINAVRYATPGPVRCGYVSIDRPQHQLQLAISGNRLKNRQVYTQARSGFFQHYASTQADRPVTAV